MRTLPIFGPDGPVVLSREVDLKWRAAYRRERYLQDLSEEELHQRRGDVFRNFMTVNADGKACPLPVSHHMHVYWRMRLLHTLEEFVLRFGPYPAGFDKRTLCDFHVPNPRSPRIAAARRATVERVFEDGKFLFKFVEPKYVKDFLVYGRVRITPASWFADPSLNAAVQDDELAMRYWLHNPSEADLRPYLHGSSSHPPFPLNGSAIVEREGSDYWVFCMSATFDPTLFDAFDRDACILLRDPIAFRDRLLWRVYRVLDVRGHAFRQVSYVDPLTQMEDDVPLPLQKHARYMYQDEVRAVWLPKRDVPKLDKPQVVELGNIEKIAEAIVL